jgi:tetratricopeptide (TPR) repeat protein
MELGIYLSAYELLKHTNLKEEAIKCLFLSNKQSNAISLCKSHLDSSPNSISLHCLLGDMAEDLDSKIRYYKKGLILSNNKSARALRSLGLLLIKESSTLKEGITMLEQSLEISSLHVSAWFVLACKYMESKQLNHALRCFARVVALKDDDSEAWSNMGVCYMNSKKTKQALLCFEQSLRINRTNWKVWLNFLILALETQQFGKSVQALHELFSANKIKAVSCAMMARFGNLFLEWRESLQSENKIDQIIQNRRNKQVLIIFKILKGFGDV